MRKGKKRAGYSPVSLLFFLLSFSLITGCSSARFSSQHHTSKLSDGEKELRKKIVLDALKYRGVKYVYGGTTPSGFDCSGFVQYIYKKFGVSLPRTVKKMEDCGVWVERKKLIAGDLVIFHNPRHVGIYSSRGKFIHASSSRGVVSDILDKEYYRKRFVGGINILSELYE
jgi:cell wall-associated NlpC family hydrolase